MIQLDYSERVSRAKELMGAERLDALILSRPNESRSLYYLTGVDRFCAHLILLRDGGNTLLLLDQDLLDAEKIAYADEIQTFTSAKSQFEAISKVLKEGGLKEGAVGVEKPFLNQSFYESLRAVLPSTFQIKDATKVTGQLRLIKTEDEIARIRKASAIAARTLEVARQAAKPGVTENEIAATVECELRRGGAETTGMSTFISSGPRTKAAHPPASSRKLQNGEVVFIDLHPRIQGYCSDLATSFMTEPTDTETTRRFKQVLESRDAAIQAKKVGDRFSSIHLDYFKRLTSYGVVIPTIPFFNNLHGVGVAANDPPSFWHPIDAHITLGMVFALAQSPVQPKTPEGIGIRFEDTYLVTESGIERLTSFEHRTNLSR
jgi:Xaa-Pro dipeptidase